MNFKEWPAVRGKFNLSKSFGPANILSRGVDALTGG
jgi:hypothetical protein